MIKTKYVFLICTIVLATLQMFAQYPKGELIEATIPSPSLANNLLGTPSAQKALVYLPPAYASSLQRFPVVYFLPGFTSDISELIDRSYQGLVLNESLDELIGRKECRESIVVVLNGRNVLGGSFYVNSRVTGNWEDYVVKDAVNHIDSKYRTIRQAGSRGICGTSMGGFGAIHLAMHHPDVFGAVYSLSPGLFDRNGLNEQGMFAANKTIYRYLAKIDEWNAMNGESAIKAYLDFILGLYEARSRDDYFFAFTYAYGAAFSPYPEAGPPFIHFPFSRYKGKTVIDNRILKRFSDGFGDWQYKTRHFRKNFRKLKAIALECGKNDEFQWIVQGTQFLSSQLNKHGILHQLFMHDGGHEDRLRESLEKRLLPFFSKHLNFD